MLVGQGHERVLFEVFRGQSWVSRAGDREAQGMAVEALSW